MSGVKIPSDFGLTEGEVPHWHGRMSWKANWLLLLLGVLTIWVFGLGVIFFIVAAVRVYGSEYFMTNRRIYVKYGIVSRRVMEIKAEWITGTALTQGFAGRILNYGNDTGFPWGARNHSRSRPCVFKLGTFTKGYKPNLRIVPRAPLGRTLQ